MLEDESHATVGDLSIRDLVTMEEYFPFVGPFQSRQDSEQGGLAATGGAEERDELSCLYVKTHVIQNGERAESFGDMIDLNAHEELPACGLQTGSCVDGE